MLHLDQTPDPLSPYQSLHRSGRRRVDRAASGDRATAERHITAVADIPNLSGVEFLLAAQYLSVARALLAEAEGHLTTAVEILAVWLDPRIVGNAHACAVRAEVLPELVRLALAAGDRAPQMRWLQRSRPMRRQMPSPTWPCGPACAVRWSRTIRRPSWPRPSTMSGSAGLPRWPSHRRRRRCGWPCAATSRRPRRVRPRGEHLRGFGCGA